MREPAGHMLKLGITGGIGSGKSTICRMFEILGVPVFSADGEAKKIMETDHGIMNAINALAGKDLFTSGKVDSNELARIIFNDKDLLEKVNSVVHPAVFKYFLEWTSSQNAPYVIMEAAILFESGADSMMDKILTIATPLEERIERLIRGKKMTLEQINERIENQFNDEIRISRSDFVIYNSEKDMVIPAILDIHDKMLKLYKQQHN